MTPSSLELAEKLEQLRMLQSGGTILVGVVDARLQRHRHAGRLRGLRRPAQGGVARRTPLPLASAATPNLLVNAWRPAQKSIAASSGGRFGLAADANWGSLHLTATAL